MAGRHGALLGALLAVGALGAGAAVLPDGALSALEARAVAWTSGTPAPSATPARKAPKKKPTRKTAPKAASSAAGRSGPVRLTCSCPKKKAAAGARLQAVQPPQVVTEQNPPSAVLVGPGMGGVDRGIADTGRHSDGTWPVYDAGRRYHPGSQATLGVTATAGTTTGSLAVSWNDIGDPATIRYRVGYQPQTWVKATGDSSWTYPPITWVTVKPLGKEGTNTWTLRTATRGVRYTVWLEVDVSTPEDTIGSTRMLLGQQSGVLVP